MSSIVLDETHDPALVSWVESAQGHSQFPIQNLPFGVFAPLGRPRRIGVAIGDVILDLTACAADGLFPPEIAVPLGKRDLNALLGLPSSARRDLRHRLSKLLSNPDYSRDLKPRLFLAAECRVELPAQIGDYTDFYVGIHHATNVGRLFRPDSPLLANYKYVPIGYHGRASSVRPSGQPVVRPSGQRKAPDTDVPSFGPSQRLDYELELGVWIGEGSDLGSAIPVGAAHDHVAGYCLLNDWSARDLQAWEYQPLGPFLAKNFHSTISPWIVTSEALAPYRRAQPARPPGDPAPLPYLWDEDDQASGSFAITLEVHILTASMRREGHAPHRLSHGDTTAMYWTVAQMVAHHSSGGCNLRPGDLLGTGTLSGPTSGSFGSLLELSVGGSEPIELPNGETRHFLEDGDEILLSATAGAPGRVSIGFGECRAVLVASAEPDAA
jgi:fumarylacetoacetase